MLFQLRQYLSRKSHFLACYLGALAIKNIEIYPIVLAGLCQGGIPTFPGQNFELVVHSE